MKLWLYESWYCDLSDKHDFTRNYSILTGGFANPEMARKILDSDSGTFKSDEESFEKMSELLLKSNTEEGARNTRQRRRRKLAK